MKQTFLFTLLFATLFLFSGCDDDDDGVINAGSDFDGAVYTMTNGGSSNDLLIYGRRSDGSLESTGRVGAGGTGSGARTDLDIGRDPLTSQDAIVLSPDEDFLYAVNAGSNTVAAFRIADNDPTDVSFVGTYPSGGTFPVAIAIDPDGDYLYVLNTGGAGTDNLPGIQDDGSTGGIQGFSINDDGSLTTLAGSAQPLSGMASVKGTIDFSPDGGILAAIEFGPVSNIVSYVITDGVAGSPNVFNTEEGEFASVGDDPFGGEFDQNGFFHTANVELTAPPEPAPEVGGSTNSTYRFAADGQLEVVTAAFDNDAIASCWLELSPDNRYAYSVNTDDRTITNYRVSDDGSITRIATTSVGPQGPMVGTSSAIDALDMTVVPGYAYTIIPIQGSIQVWRVASDGTLSLSTDGTAVDNVPITAQGIAATGDDGP